MIQAMDKPPYHSIRMRRLRRGDLLRDLVAQTTLSPANLVMPLFVRRGENIRRPIVSMPGQYQLSPDQALEDLAEMAGGGLRAYLLFAVVDDRDKDEAGSHAHDPDNAVCTTLRLARAAGINMLAITDLCFCEYTSHGHCGVIRGRDVDNDETVKLLVKEALSHARAGADMVAPSDMMDGRVGAIREALDGEGFTGVPIMSYAAKYASAFYGPFREAAESTPQFGDRRSYQMDPPNRREALREVALDIEEGADLVMVKPALAYLDIISDVRAAFDIPVAAYNVSGEYSLVKAAGRLGWIDEERVMLECLTAMKRAGADLILTYFAKDAAKLL